MSAAATLEAISLAADLITASTQLMAKAQTVTLTLQKAHMEGRTITKDELKAIKDLDDQARDRLARLL